MKSFSPLLKFKEVKAKVKSILLSMQNMQILLVNHEERIRRVEHCLLGAALSSALDKGEEGEENE